MQDGQPLAYFSNAFSQRNMGLSTYEKELLAVVMAVNKWRGYLMGQPFTIKTDQEAIKHLLSQKITTLMQQKWLTKLLGFDYTIVYKREKDNVVVDPLSRLHEEAPIQVLEAKAITIVIPQWKVELKNSWEEDTDVQAILTRLAVDPTSESDYSLKYGDLRYQGKLYVIQGGNLRSLIIQNLVIQREVIQASTPHLRGSAIFFGGPVFIRMSLHGSKNVKHAKGVKENVFHIQAFFNLFLYLTRPGTLSLWTSSSPCLNLEVKTLFWLLSINTQSIVINWLCSTHLLLPGGTDNVFKLYGPPNIIITDRDKIFTSSFWAELFKKLGCNSRLSTA